MIGFGVSTPAWYGMRKSLRPEFRLVLQAFFDDSGKESQRDHQFVCIAGYLGHDQSWWRFVQRWRHLLLRHGLRDVHMKNWETIRQRHGWAKSYSNRILGEFIDAIKDAQLIGFGVAVDANVWRGLPSENRKWFGNAQNFCFSRIMRRIIDRLDVVGDPDHLEIVFDQDFEYSSQRMNLLKHFYKHDARLAAKVSSIAFSDSQAYSQLQAADILAWETRRHLVNKVGQTPETAEWHKLFSPLQGYEMEFAAGEYWDAKEIGKNLEELLRERASATAQSSARSVTGAE